VDPELLRGAFRIGFLVAILALITVPFQPPESAEFVVTVLALVMGIVFAGLVLLVARLSSPPIPRSRDKASVSGYNTKIPAGKDGRKPWKKSNER
jgi:peptidoglycan/LPS O-acetylase OafA/YrhL